MSQSPEPSETPTPHSDLPENPTSNSNALISQQPTKPPSYEILSIHIIHSNEKKTLRLPDIHNKTVADLFDALCQKLLIAAHFRQLFSLCYILPEKQDQNERERTVLVGNGKIVEKWLNFRASVRDEIFQGDFENKPLRVFLRMKYYKRLHLDSVSQDNVVRELVYKQFHWKVCTNEFSCPDFEAVNLAALALQKQFGDYSAQKFKPGYLKRFILQGEILPLKSDYIEITPENVLEWEQRLTTLWNLKYTSEFTRKRAAKEYLNVVMNCIATYGFLFIDDVWIVNARHRCYLMGIAEDGIYLFQRHDVCILKEVFLFESTPTIREYFAPDSQNKKDVKLYVNVLYEWAVTARGLKIVDGNNREHHFVLGEHRREQVSHLLDGYYKLLTQRQSEEDLNGDPEGDDAPRSPNRLNRSVDDASMLMSPDLYHDCTIKLRQFNRFTRQLSYIKTTYAQKCGDNGLALPKFAQSLDLGLDLDIPFEMLDLRERTMTDAQFQNVVDSIVDSCIYCEKNTAVKRDLNFTKLMIFGDALTTHSIPYISELVEYCPNLKDISISNFRAFGKNVARIAGALSQLRALGHLELEGCDVNEQQELTLSHNLFNVLIDVR